LVVRQRALIIFVRRLGNGRVTWSGQSICEAQGMLEPPLRPSGSRSFQSSAFPGVRRRSAPAPPEVLPVSYVQEPPSSRSTGRPVRRTGDAQRREPVLGADIAVLRSRGLNDGVLRAILREGPAGSASPARLLLERGLVTEEDYYCAFAEATGLGFLSEGSFVSRHNPGFPPPLEMRGPLPVGRSQTGEILFAVAPAPESLAEFQSYLTRFPEMRQRIRIASPRALSRAIAAADPGKRLSVERAQASARQTMPGGQIAVVCGILATFAGGLLLTPGQATVGLSVGVTLLGMIPGVARMMAGAAGCRSRLPKRAQPAGPPPFYSVLVPLYREARVAPVLAAALGALDYPHQRLEVLFLLEEDDHETRAALKPLLMAHMRTVVLPAGEPRTKPRALCHGLAIARGELIAVYDGEDRPEPDQLRLAAARFCKVPPRVAGLQAHLAIDHGSHRIFARQFRLEYAGLFDCLLPWLSARGWPFPLGGTSNHFRRSALEAVGGWDPYNVTEDADLSLRLSRAGYDLQTLASTTFEEAPLNWSAWHKQRTRWLKGWLQTLLVTLRDPVVLAGELRRTKTIVPLVYLVSMVVTLAAHPIFLGILLAYGSGISPVPFNASWQANATLSLAGTSVALAYGSMTVLAFAGARARGHWPPFVDLLFIPLYWLAQSLAFYAAVVDLVRRPHAWSKTEHGLARRPGRLPGGAKRAGWRA
jgi:cellulose synthase/poly-beta-1,6-N-acetylglucosamine synthase-like glycosyltransferase